MIKHQIIKLNEFLIPAPFHNILFQGLLPSNFSPISYNLAAQTLLKESSLSIHHRGKTEGSLIRLTLAWMLGLLTRAHASLRVPFQPRSRPWKSIPPLKPLYSSEFQILILLPYGSSFLLQTALTYIEIRSIFKLSDIMLLSWIRHQQAIFE